MLVGMGNPISCRRPKVDVILSKAGEGSALEGSLVLRAFLSLVGLLLPTALSTSSAASTPLATSTSRGFFSAILLIREGGWSLISFYGRDLVGLLLSPLLGLLTVLLFPVDGECLADMGDIQLARGSFQIGRAHV